MRLCAYLCASVCGMCLCVCTASVCLYCLCVRYVSVCGSCSLRGRGSSLHLEAVDFVDDVFKIGDEQLFRYLSVHEFMHVADHVAVRPLRQRRPAEA